MKIGSAHSDETTTNRYFYGEIDKSVLVNQLGITAQAALTVPKRFLWNMPYIIVCQKMPRPYRYKAYKSCTRSLPGELYVCHYYATYHGFKEIIFNMISNQP